MAMGVACVVLLLLGCSKGPPPSPETEEEDLFHTACVRCHGKDGTGGPPDSLGHPGPRNFTDPAFQRSRTDDQLRLAIEDGNRGMPAFGAVLTPRQIDMMIAHVRKFDTSAPPRAKPASSAASGGSR
jgi:mono/diheme cytochrome c family protein